MDKGDDPAFPTNRAGHSPEPGMSIRDYVSVEILKALMWDKAAPATKWCVAKSFEVADLWLAEREKRTAPKAQ